MHRFSLLRTRTANTALLFTLSNYSLIQFFSLLFVQYIFMLPFALPVWRNGAKLPTVLMVLYEATNKGIPEESPGSSDPAVVNSMP